MLDAACARTRALHGPGRLRLDLAQCSGLLQTLALHEPLEDRNAFFAWLFGEVFLKVNGIHMDSQPEEALALVMSTGHKNASVQEIAAQFRLRIITI
ncbi:hypothetical protein OHB53_08540 [Streptomyces sp. NBC_00056]|uniref:hypothetical protein n=1 Tax=Streptomyces sp. NBC_00056 TaxID=2975633 RepID=UPI00324710D5